ncbi:zinc finger protein 91-like isoform X1 [Pararge aegeria]|uniref:Jg22180 protein n=2 Tax=Pararge aegeria TaxID=116150 RepID=A0A8S4S9V4_9NEOP|nr:zinc finger protein 91-like isoform X1 [Pararge aegeria]CAH2253849.1 jg22180 [Pararge aegeria aegeria]
MEDNVHDCCRICLDVESRHVSILDDSTINLHIKSCLPINISVNDDLPKSICESCVSQLKEFYNFQLNARCSQDWLESCVQEKSKKSIESKTQVHPLPDSEYNSDSLLEFLNNTENIEEYLNNLGKEDIPSIVNMLDRTVGTEANKIVNGKSLNQLSPKKSPNKTQTTKMDIDVLDSDIKIVKELMKKAVPKNETKSIEKLSCFACKAKLDTIHKLSQHLSICDNAIRTCIYCNILFDSKQKMREHALIHSAFTPLTCNCGKQFDTKDNLLKHCKRCETDHIASMGFVYSCKQCKATFNEWLQMFQHAKEHVRKSEERICDICGHTFIGEESIAKHRKEKHEKPDNPLYRCKVCSFTSPDRKKIFCHVQKHTQAKSTIRHLCESCGRSFANQSVLRNHSLQHAPKSHKCRICQKGFTDMKLKEEHVLEHIEMVMCEKCGQSVKSYKLAEHVCL